MKKKRTVLANLAISLVLVSLLLTPTLAASPSAPATGAPQTLTANGIYDSGWQNHPAGQCKIYSHNLGANPNNVVYAVDLWFRDLDAIGMGINRFGYGGLDVFGAQRGVFWRHLTAEHVVVCRGADNLAADQVRVRVWIPDSSGAYVSPWTAINPGDEQSFEHNLGDTKGLVVGLQFRSPSEGINQHGYGGLFLDTPRQSVGALWYDLTEEKVTVRRLANDGHAEEVRISVVRAESPWSDTGWQPLSIGPNMFDLYTEGVVGPRLIRAECRQTAGPDAPGIHQMFAGGVHLYTGLWFGAYLSHLGEQSVNAQRFSDDGVCPEIRIRVWLQPRKVYIPLAVLNEG